MLKVGLTGSIATGKSFVCGVFSGLGCHVLDADQASRTVVEKGSPGLAKVVDAFGNSVLSPDGSLDRKMLGSIVFADTERRELLNSIIHPLVIELQDQWVDEIEKKTENAIVIVDAALMIESGGYKRFQKLIVVWCEKEVQLKRLMERDGLAVEDAEKRINSQLPQEEKRKFADFEINTTMGFDSATRQAQKVFLELEKAEKFDR